MLMKSPISGIKLFISGRYGSLLLALLLLIVLQPVVATKPGKYILEAMFAAVLFAALPAIRVKKFLLSFEIVLLALSLALHIAGSSLGYETPFLFGIAGRILFLFLVALTILLDLFRSRKVTSDTLAGAVCIYLMIALIWGYSYLLAELLVPGSFSFTQGHARLQLWLSREIYPFFYFSLVTMTTVGYGDMTPVTTTARTLATLEALVGQVYLTILVARLVGLHLLHQQENKSG
jgi:voltage-gated potassium channel